MAEEKQKRGRGIPVGGIVLLFLGVVFLLQTFNIIPWGLWGMLWRFWPAILIIIGLGILLRRYNPWLISLLILVILFACLGLAIWQYGPSKTVESQLYQSYTQPGDNLEKADIRMDLPVGNLALAALPAGSPNLVEAGFTQNRHNAALKASYSREGTTGILNMQLEQKDWPAWSSGEFKWQAAFSRDIPLTMDIKSAVSNFEADLSELKVTELRMKLDVGNFNVVLPSAPGDGKVSIDSALSNLDITIPQGVAARIKARADLGSAEIDKSRFPKQGDYYISGDWDSAGNRLDIDVKCDLGRVGIK